MELMGYKKGLIKESLDDMTHIVIIQMHKSKQALIKNDVELMIEVLENLKRINLLKLKLDYDCRDFLALYTPVAVDLRFILATLKIGKSLEQIAKNLEKICKVLKKKELHIDKTLMGVFKPDKMFDTAVLMLTNMQEALEQEDTSIAIGTFPKDLLLNEKYREADVSAMQWLETAPEKISDILSVLTIVHKIERIGDETKNIGENIVFHLEAKVLRHTPLF